jgi:hypothetical protein
MRYLPAILVIGLVAGILGGCSGASGPSASYASAGNLSDSWGWDARSSNPGYVYGQYDRYLSGRGSYQGLR